MLRFGLPGKIDSLWNAWHDGLVAFAMVTTKYTVVARP